ncbi:MAG: hypothetical protein AABW65_01755 [Nanoarchaeota archaeon]
MIMAIFANAYLIKEAFGNRVETGIISRAIVLIGKIIFKDGGIVSAIEQSVMTCLKSKDNKICQTYLSEECKDKCLTNCIPVQSSEILDCAVGTCYDLNEGSCTEGSPKAKCEEDGGKWFNDPNGNVKECKRGCCVVKDKTYFSTEKMCERISSSSGFKKDFRAEIRDEATCVGLAKTQEEGACILETEEGNKCKFTTKSDCLQNIKGIFNSGYLCSKEELKTNCKEQSYTSCVEGRSEIYWFDSCGNKENIYDINKIKSWNNGMILSKEQSCSLSLGNNPLANQARCGNCNYLLGSTCGKKTLKEKLSEENHDAVCRSLLCIDKEGKTRENGESWCEYQGAIGLREGRSADTPGSRHFRKVCSDGEIRTEPCADYRNEICVEARKNAGGKELSTSSCRINLAYQCYGYNQKKENKCEENPDCFIKKVYVSGNFNFNLCVPKYKPGFNFEERGDVSEKICGTATQSCTVVYIKKLKGWRCAANCECAGETFTQQMNDLCISLGDCGASVNYQGTLSESYSIQNGAKLSSAYMSGIRKYADEKQFKGQLAEPGEKYFLELGIPGLLGAHNYREISAFQESQFTGTILGIGGLIVMGVLHSGIVGGISGPFAAIFTAGGTGATAIAGASGALSGAAIGLAITSILLDVTGVGKGLPPAMVYGLMAVGTVSSAIIGLKIATAGLTSGCAILVACVAFAVVIIFVLILKLFGIGKKRETAISFTCNPWMAQTGGKECNKCGKDGFPCAKYACESLGQSCEFINEDEKGVGECIEININDVSPPTIRAMTELLPKGYSHENLESGIKIKSEEKDGCISESYNLINFGLELNEHGQCRINANHTSSWDDMEDIASGTSRFVKNHTFPIIIPNLQSIILDAENKYDPFAKFDFNFYVRCQDKRGNKNEKEFVINFCVKQGPDATPPIIIDREPYLENVAFNTEKLNASVYVNEPAQCKWDEKDIEYELMKNEFGCKNGLDDRKLPGWPCNSVFPVKEENHTYYVKCLDQPWLEGINDSSRNKNTESYKFNIIKTKTDLNIDSINVDGKEFSFATEPASVEVIVKTSGGLDGNARCFYKIGNNSIEFRYGSWTNTHRQVFETLYSGEIYLPVMCEDLIGNIAEKTATFKIKLDIEPPRITRIYNLHETLNIITDEKGTCFYNFNKNEQCSFNLENASRMDGDEITHSTPFDIKNTYYIKCSDEFGNTNGECGAVVKEGGI